MLEMEAMTFEGLPKLEAEYSKATPRKRARLLNAYTAEIHDKCAARWKELEAKYWLMFGRGF